MSLLESIFIPLGTKMPEFKLNDCFGKVFNSADLFDDRGLLVAFTCNHCPYAKAVWNRFIKLAHYSKDLRINTVAINPNIHPDFPEDSTDKMKKKVEEWKIDFPYLVDETQETAKAFRAQCTPDIFLFNKNQELIYHGRIDDNWEDESKVTCNELKIALDNHASGMPISSDQKPCMGCSIKWK